MSSKITNLYNKNAIYSKIPVERVWLYQPEGEWCYSHHPHITFFAGRFFAIWSNGMINEDDIGQRVLISSSDDFISWSSPIPMVESQPDIVYTAAGFHQYNGKLIAYIGQYEYKTEVIVNGQRQPADNGHINTKLSACFTSDGDNWSDLIDMGIAIVPNHGPQPTASGRLIISGNISFPYTDDHTGLSGWKMTGIYPSDMADGIVDDSESFWKVRDKMKWPVGLCEGSFYQTNDNIIHLLLRSNENHLWVTESSDDGATWSTPVSTEFTDNATKFHFGKLPDGRFYYVGCPDPQPRGQRNPLVLSLSNDGVIFNYHAIIADEKYDMKYPGMHKGGDYGYPHTMIHAGYLYVIVSRQKEAVEVLRVKISGLHNFFHI
jgi:hypothetical protein